jgi:hypothetical protein
LILDILAKIGFLLPTNRQTLGEAAVGAQTQSGRVG